MTLTESRSTLLMMLAVGIFLALLSIFNLVPLIWMISTSLKLEPDVYHMPVKLLPSVPTLTNYIEVLSDPRIIRYFMNSFFIAGGASVVCVILGIFAGYGFTRYDFPGKRLLLGYVLYLMVLPRVVLVVPLYLLLVKMGAQGTYQGLIFVYLVIALPLSIWLFSAFFRTIPIEIEDSARIDGCNTVQLVWKIVVPLVKPCIFAVFMYSFVLSWNEYLFALIFSSTKTAPMTVGLVSYAGETMTQWGRIMAAACLMTIPTIVIFNVFGKYLSSGLAAGAVKG